MIPSLALVNRRYLVEHRLVSLFQYPFVLEGGKFSVAKVVSHSRRVDVLMGGQIFNCDFFMSF